jgi:folate-binding protein YgfZ
MNLDVYHRILAGETLTFILAPRSLWRLSGPDALRYLNGQITADVTKLADGQGCYASVCTAKGRMEGDLFVARHGADFYLDAAFVLHESLGLRLEKYLIADDAAFEDLADLWTLHHVFGAPSPAVPEGGFSVPNSRYGLPGHDVWIPTDRGAALVEETVAADVIETLRLENGIPMWGAELTQTTLPPEGGPRLLDSISYSKGCYVGQETIARLKSVGHVNRTLVFLRSDSSAAPLPATKLQQADREVGVITSGGFSPRLECGIALGYLQRALAETGTEVVAGNIKLTVAAALEAGAK